MQIKVCSKCNKAQPKTKEYFYWHKKSKRLYAQCKNCVKKRIYTTPSNKWVIGVSKHPEKVLQKRRYKHFKEKNKSTISFKDFVIYEKQMQCYKQNKKIFNDLRKRLNKLTPKQHKNYTGKLSFAEKKERVLKKYAVPLEDQHKYDHYKKISSLRYKVKYDYDINFNLQERLRRQLKKKTLKYPHLGDMLRKDIKDNKNRIYSLLGYTTKDLVKHLQKMFTEDMSLEKLLSGEIHIDHIAPQAWFNLNNDEDVRKCWALDNLQPLWASENLAKRDKMILTEHNIQFNNFYKQLYESKKNRILNANKS